MSKPYRMILGAAAVVAVLAVGGIAAAEQGGQSGDHRQNPTTTSADPTTTSVAPDPVLPQGVDNQSDVEDQGEGPSSESEHARCDIALNSGADIGQWNKAQAPAFADCDSGLLATDRPQPGNSGGQGQGGAPVDPGSQGQDHSQGAGPDNSNAQGHGKP